MERALQSCVEFDMAGRPNRLHAIAWYDGQPWPATICGLAAQAYVATRTDWAATPAEQRCARCQTSLDASTVDGRR
jgi:hypothetical protein